MSLANSLGDVDETPAAEKTITPKPKTKAQAKPPAAATGQQIELEDAIRAKTGRPIGKSKNPEFTQLGPYVRKTTKKAVELRLMQEGDQEISDLIESLLIKWLAH